MPSQTHHHSPASLHRHHHEMDGAACFEKKGGNELLAFAFGDELDDFSVDDLLDFPDTKDEVEAEATDGKSMPCVLVKFDAVVSGGGFEFAPTEISVPVDDVAELEWLSNFVDDSFIEYSLAYSGLKLQQNSATVTQAAANGGRLFPPPMTKSRAKRGRSSGRSWSLSASETSSSSSSSNSTSNSTSSAPAKRLRRSLDGSVRRCSHCGVQKTPQWRAGPEGAKTLCNACGVRFKSGRLVPEYRPACSPTFCSELHSNQHRKVVEMRRMKEVGAAAASCFGPVV